MTIRHRMLFCLPMLMLLVSVGCHTCSDARLSCGDRPSCGESCCTAGTDPLIIFVGADRDVAKLARVPQLAEDFRACGFDTIYIDPWKQLKDHELVADKIRHAVRCRGQRVMIVGWSYGAVVGLKALQIVRKEGICIDSFVELDCFNLKLHMRNNIHPYNAGNVIVIRSQLNSPIEGYCRPRAYRLNSAWHLGLPTHSFTRRVLLSEANRIRSASMQMNMPEPVPTEVPELSVSAPEGDALPAEIPKDG